MSCSIGSAAGSCGDVQIGTEGASLEFRDEQLDAARKQASFESDRKTVCNANSFQSEEGSAEIEESWNGTHTSKAIRVHKSAKKRMSTLSSWCC